MALSVLFTFRAFRVSTFSKVGINSNKYGVGRVCLKELSASTGSSVIQNIFFLQSTHFPLTDNITCDTEEQWFPNLMVMMLDITCHLGGIHTVTIMCWMTRMEGKKNT